MVRTAHGTAAGTVAVAATEPRPAGLLQTVAATATVPAIAVLEQPSPRRMLDGLLGRRNIVLSQSDELNTRENTQKVSERHSRRKLRCRPIGRCRRAGSFASALHPRLMHFALKNAGNPGDSQFAPSWYGLRFY